MPLPANANRWSGPLKSVGRFVSELGPWFALVGVLAGVLAVLARHLQAFCREAEAFAASVPIGGEPSRPAPPADRPERAEEVA